MIKILEKYYYSRLRDTKRPLDIGIQVMHAFFISNAFFSTQPQCFLTFA